MAQLQLTKPPYPKPTKQLTRADLYSWAQIGHLKLLERVRSAGKGVSANLRKRWRCECSCGNIIVVPEFYFLREKPKTHCGCQFATLASTNKDIHGIWLMMHQRCYFPHFHAYKDYGGRGIYICDQWNRTKTPKEEAFKNFLEYMGPRPSPKHSVDRYPDNNGPYAPGNVRWATPEQQANNRRR